jgi:hypothetical protein
MNPKGGINADLYPVKDFKTQAQLDTLAATTPKPNDQDSYIVTTGANPGSIATWDAANNMWKYYVPSIDDITTMLNPSISQNQGKWKYTGAANTTGGWEQETTTIVVPDPDQYSIGGFNIVMRQDHNRSKNGVGVSSALFIQNDGILAFGANQYHNGGDAATNGGFPRKIPFLWTALEVDATSGATTFRNTCNYVPKFIMVDYSRYGAIACDHLGKVWTLHISADISGQTTTPTSNVAALTGPTLGFYPCKFFQARTDIKVAKVYCQGVNNGLAGGVFSSWAALDTTGDLWVSGYNGFGELGLGDRVNKQGWFQSPITNVKEVKFVMRGCFILSNNGDLYFTGQDQGGWTNALNVVYSSPVLIATNVNNFDFSGYNATTVGVVKNDNTLWMGGLNPNGLQGRGNLIATTSITQVPGITNAKTITLDRKYDGGEYSVLLRTDNTVSFAGKNRTGIHGYSLNASEVNNTTFVTPTFAVQGTIVDVMAGFGNAVVRTNSGAIWISGLFVTSGLGMPENSTWTNRNMFKLMPLPEPVIAMESVITVPTEVDGYRFLTQTRGIIGVGAAFAFNSNASYNVDTASYRQMGDLRTWNNGITVTPPLSVNYTYLDAIANVLSTSLSAYNSAADGAWVEVTAAEYANVMTVQDAQKSIGTDAQMATPVNSSVVTNVTQGMSTGNQVLTPIATYPIAISFKTGTVAPTSTAGMKLRYAANNANGFFNQIAGVIPNVASPAANTQYYFVQKKATAVIPTVGGWAALYAPLANQLGRIAGGSSLHVAGEGTSLTTTTAFTPLFQVITTRIKNW